jgi:hypothetical protein
MIRRDGGFFSIHGYSWLFLSRLIFEGFGSIERRPVKIIVPNHSGTVPG